MLISLHVKNFAIIDEVWVDFGEGLNVLTGETGAGKSILLGSVGVALGGKVSKDFLGKNGDYALAELVFDGENEAVRQLLAQYELPQSETLVISRRIMQNGRSISKINGEVVTAAVLREIAGILLDVHGQHEHQSLLYRSAHLEMLDRYIREESKELLRQIRMEYREYRELKTELAEAERHQESRERELSLVQYEYDEITEAALKDGEDEVLEERYRILSNTSRIEEAVGGSVELLSGGEDNASEYLGRALRQMSKVTAYDTRLEQMYESLRLIEEQVTDLNCQMADYAEELSGSAEELYTVEERLNRINRLKSKYGKTIPEVQAYAKKQEAQLDKLLHYDQYLQKLTEKKQDVEQKLSKLCAQMTKKRQKAAKELTDEITAALLDLNFLDVVFEIRLQQLEEMNEHGADEAEFLISTNPGEPVRPLAKVASGGELSRIMLALKSVFAGKDEIETLIFDEIDVGISGRTAQKVAEKMAKIAADRQVLCITHLPQIAAMGDTHFLIEKHAEDGATVTEIKKLQETEVVTELARMLGGAEITSAVMESAGEMKRLADEKKKQLSGSREEDA